MPEFCLWLAVGSGCFGAFVGGFLTAKLRKVEADELSTVLFTDYKMITDFVVNSFGANRLVDDLASDDFATLRASMAKR